MQAMPVPLSSANYGIPETVTLPIWNAQRENYSQLTMPSNIILINKITEAYAQNLPCVLAVTADRTVYEGEGKLAIGFKQAHQFIANKETSGHVHYVYMLRTNPGLFHHLHNNVYSEYKYDTDNFFSEYLRATAGTFFPLDPQLVATCQYYMALRFRHGAYVPQSNAEAYNFAFLAARAGLASAKVLMQELSTQPVPNFPINPDFYTSEEVGNVTLVFRELIARMPQPAVVKDFKIVPLLDKSQYNKSETYQFGSRMGGGPTCHEHICFQFKFHITAVVTTPEGEKVVKRIHRENFYPSWSHHGADDKSRCFKIAEFLALGWGLEIRSAMLESDPLHSRVKPLADYLVFTADLAFKTHGVCESSEIEDKSIYTWERPAEKGVKHYMHIANDWSNILASRTIRKIFQGNPKINLSLDYSVKK